MVSTPSPLRIVSRWVSWNAFMRIFSTTRSPAWGSSPATAAAPQVPRTSALASATPRKSGAFSFNPGAPSSTM